MCLVRLSRRIEHVLPSQETRALVAVALACGLLAPLVYIAADVSASLSYPGYSYTDQAVSELFAIGAPTSEAVVRLFTVSSALLLAFAPGIRGAAPQDRLMRWLAWLVALNAVVSLVLWNVFPMHMRGAQPTMTDTMHGLLATNPFPLLAIGVAAAGSRTRFPGWFRAYSWVTLVFVAATAASAFLFVPEFLANQPTPWMGLAERAGQYAHQAWHAVFAMALLRSSVAVTPAHILRGE